MVGSMRNELGRHGEDVAAQYLAERGMVVLSRNWRCREGELDLVATDRKRLVVCEVKTRSGLGFGGPAEAVTPAKAARIRRLAVTWLPAGCPQARPGALVQRGGCPTPWVCRRCG